METLRTLRNKTNREIDALIHMRIFGECPHLLHAYARDNQDPKRKHPLLRCRHCRRLFLGDIHHEDDLLVPSYTFAGVHSDGHWQKVTDYIENMGLLWKVTAVQNGMYRVEISDPGGEMRRIVINNHPAWIKALGIGALMVWARHHKSLLRLEQ